MWPTILATLAGVILGAALGYFVRAHEFRREQRLALYGEFVADFLGAAHAGAGLQSLSMQHGPTIPPSAQAQADALWRSWREAQQAFEATAARLRIIASSDVRLASETLEAFLEENIRSVPPFANADTPAAWGEAARAGPRVVDSTAVQSARTFADFASRDIVTSAKRTLHRLRRRIKGNGPAST